MLTCSQHCVRRQHCALYASGAKEAAAEEGCVTSEHVKEEDKEKKKKKTKKKERAVSPNGQCR